LHAKHPRKRISQALHTLLICSRSSELWLYMHSAPWDSHLELHHSFSATAAFLFDVSLPPPRCCLRVNRLRSSSQRISWTHQPAHHPCHRCFCRCGFHCSNCTGTIDPPLPRHQCLQDRPTTNSTKNLLDDSKGRRVKSCVVGWCASNRLLEPDRYLHPRH